jgi:hypothetical protein
MKNGLKATAGGLVLGLIVFAASSWCFYAALFDTLGLDQIPPDSPPIAALAVFGPLFWGVLTGAAFGLVSGLFFAIRFRSRLRNSV